MSDKGEVVKRLIGLKCPKCNKDIDFLKNYQSGEKYYTVSVEENELGDYDEQEFLPDGKVNEFECPFCSEVLLTKRRH